jgi:ribosomal protein L10
MRVVRNTIFRKALPSVVSGGAKFKLVFCAKYDRGLDLGFWEILAAIM